jgi:hypothetical protein
MARFRYDREMGCTVEVRDLPNFFDENPLRADFPCPSVVSDGLGSNVNGLRHMCNGRMYDSKSNFRRITKDHGCIEIGNEYNNTPQTLGAPRPGLNYIEKRQAKAHRVAAIKRSIDDHRSGRIARGEVSRDGER